MACFIVPATLGILTHSARKKFSDKWHIDWLNTMVFGGSIALAIEHIAHGEIILSPPFLTAMGTSANTAIMLNEMAAVGIPMTVALVGAWAAMVVIYEKVIMAQKDGASSPTL